MRIFSFKIPHLAFPKITPAHVACLCSAFGVGLAVAGIYLLVGIGWALLSAAVAPLLLAAVLIRGLLHG